jgi:hypothetical protein
MAGSRQSQGIGTTNLSILMRLNVLSFDHYVVFGGGRCVLGSRQVQVTP